MDAHTVDTTTIDTTIPKEVLDKIARAKVTTSNIDAMVVTNAGEYKDAAETLKGLSEFKRELDADRKAITGPLESRKKEIIALFKPPIETIDSATKTLKSKMLTFENAQEKKRREEEARIAEQQRKERERLEARALKAEESGKTEKAEALRQQADISPTAVTLDNGATKVSGVAKRTTWSGECFDKKALIKAVAEGKAPDTLLEVNTVTLNKLAVALKGSMNYPGCRAVSKQTLAA